MTQEQYEQHQKKTTSSSKPPIQGTKPPRAGIGKPKAVLGTPIPKPKMNKTETEYHLILKAKMQQGEIRDIIGFESIKLKVGEDRCWYTPDFAVIGSNGVLELHEVKGAHVWDDAKVKFKSARLQFKCFRWIWAQRIKGQWKISGDTNLLEQE